ncbi:MAG: bifunctional diaminohydroxyphosphoribosylaminopyrimidine deaminase/5-amino-6-(5-phosphoribosylamino)uracil reductase RibD [Candidatus Latescibacteria bacterium]|nr:bifunctional diaminohydroxyphosphoribosylaminopyrimidine deaminase/5-amino-6-(5-phosphoribosylamino)uracil reductase RibD [Candidatus Latescibacterota bacterium]
MNKNKTDEFYMRLAIKLAERGRGCVSPNPLVGAVIVKNNKIIGQGYHTQFGGAHAEVNAFRNAKQSVKGATLYVTLEPCNFLEKKTPPCVPAIIKAGIKRVVIGTLDCNPKTCKKGVHDLRKAGIKTKIGVLKKEVEKQNEAYFKHTHTGIPLVSLKLGLFLDGRIATKNGESKWITSPASRQFSQQLRRENDAILVGINTILRDDPRLTCRIDRHKKLTRIILDPNLQTPKRSQVLNSNYPTIIFTRQKSDAAGDNCQIKLKNLEIIPVRCVGNLLSWYDILEELGQRNIASLLIEGGAQVASSALQMNIVDKISLIYAPKILGQGISFSDHLSLCGLESAIRLKDYNIITCGKDFIVQAYLH